MKTEEIAGLWIFLSFIIGAVGSTRKIGFWGGFACSLLLSPLIGFIIVICSDKPAVMVHKYKEYKELANRELYKGNIDVAIDNYKNAMYHLENDYKHLVKGGTEDKQRIKTIESIMNKLEEINQTNESLR